MRRDGGHVLVELLVASACTALVGAGALSLLVNGAAAARRSSEWLEGVAAAEACRAALGEDLGRAVGGYPGARFIRQAGARRRPVEVGPTRLALLLPTTPAVEVEAEPDGYYRAEAGALAEQLPGATVVALPAVEGVAILGTIAAFASVAGGDRVQVRWSPSDVAGLPDPVRALVLARWREYALPSPDDPRVRRRDAGGGWQPVIDNVTEIAFQLVATVDRSAQPERVVIPPDALADPEVIRGVRVACLGSGGDRAAGWAGR